jgi:hypothetical protein
MVFCTAGDSHWSVSSEFHPGKGGCVPITFASPKGLHCLELAKVAFNLHVQCEEQPQQDVMHGKGASAAYLQEAAIYTIWAKENLACSTSMKGPRSAGSDQSIAEEILDMEHRCAAEWIT